MKRPDKTEYYLGIAQQVAARGTCLRRRFGAVIVKDDQIISTGYVGAPRGSPNCIDIGKCLRQELNVAPGERYELCRSVHAEANAIINAARSGVSTIGGTLFLISEDVEKGNIHDSKPCRMCRRMIINAGITKVIVKLISGYEEHGVKDWIKEDFEDEEKGNVGGY